MPLDVTALRAASQARARDRPRGPELDRVEDLILPDTPAVRARRYRADAATARPTLVYLHGGMWVLGSLQSHDRLCRQLAAEAGVDVLAVDYRRAPEARYPAPVEDALAAVRWVDECTEAPAIALGGDYAGGTIATLAALRLRDGEGDVDLAALVLFCPNADLTADAASPEIVAAAHLWAPSATSREAASPLLAPDLSGLPPTLLLTAEHDALRAEGDALAGRLAEAGVPVTHRVEAGAEHGFVMSDGAPLDRALADVRAAFTGR
jgi:acetyl esterase/lipase